MQEKGLISGLGKFPRGGNGYPLQCSCLDNFIEEPGRQQSIGSQRVRHDWANEHEHEHGALNTLKSKFPICKLKKIFSSKSGFKALNSSPVSLVVSVPPLYSKGDLLGDSCPPPLASCQSNTGLAPSSWKSLPWPCMGLFKTWRRVCGGWECGLCGHSPWVWILALWPWTRYLTTPGSSFLGNGEKNHTYLMELGGWNEIIHRKHSAIVSITNYVNSEVSSVKQKWPNSMAELRSSSSRSVSLVLCWS